MARSDRKSNQRKRNQERLLQLLTVIAGALAMATAIIQLVEVLLSLHHR
jgi:hypothetical protein